MLHFALATLRLVAEVFIRGARGSGAQCPRQFPENAVYRPNESAKIVEDLYLLKGCNIRHAFLEMEYIARGVCPGNR
jgi:hypothetical protein